MGDIPRFRRSILLVQNFSYAFMDVPIKRFFKHSKKVDNFGYLENTESFDGESVKNK